jgi:transposase-like protein
VANRPIYVVIGVIVDGVRDMVRLWVGDGGEVAKYWAHLLTEIKRGTRTCRGHTEATGSGKPYRPSQTRMQACVVHLLRNSIRYASREDGTAAA